MCGISAIYSGSNTHNSKDIIFNLLKKLQHRGQDSYGYSDGNIVEKYIGLIKEKPKKLNGNIILGHTRYCTSGIVNLKMTQPMKKGELTLIHNGNINNLFSDVSDTMSLLNFLNHYLRKDNIIEVIKKAIFHVEGSFFIIMIHNNNLYAFKDKNGTRPGLYGIDDNGNILISSENNNYDTINTDIMPGEILEIKEDRIINKYQTFNDFRPCIFEYIYLSHPQTTIYGLKVKDFRTRIARSCVDLLTGIKINVVCGVPNSSVDYGMEVARTLNKKYIEPFVKNKRSFILPTQEEREKCVKDKFTFPEHLFEYDNVLIVDDSVIRGTTSKHLIKCFTDKGCKVTFLSCSPMVVNTNKLGINITTKEELLSYKRNLQEMADYLGCEKIIYQTIENLYKYSGFKKLELSMFKK